MWKKKEAMNIVKKIKPTVYVHTDACLASMSETISRGNYRTAEIFFWAQVPQ